MQLPPWLQLPLGRFREHAAPRGWVLLAAAALGFVARCTTPAPPPRTVEGIAAMLGSSVGGEVRPDDYIWEERGGVVHDALLGRRVLFLARPPGGARDLYRGRVRLTRTGRALSIAGIRNLTETPLGDDGDLVARGPHVAFTTRAGREVEGITLLYLGGEGGARQATTSGERLRARIESWLDAGTSDGVGRTEITFGVAPADARIEIGADALVMALGADALPAAVALEDGTLNSGPRNAYEATALRRPHPVRPLAPLAGDLGRAIAGERAGMAMEGAILGAQGIATRVRRSTRPRPARLQEPGKPVMAAQGAEPWPPPSLTVPLPPPAEGEGVWTAPPSPLPPLVGGTEGAPPYLCETAIRPDPAAPSAIVRLVAMDMRQLELRYGSGFDSPRPITGPRGPAAIPASELASGRVVAAFNGGITFRGDALGAAALGRVLVPPRAGLPAVAISRTGVAAIGAWPFDAELPEGIIAVRQGPRPLIDAAGGAAPRAEAPLERADAVTERSALCRTRAGQLVYAWALDATARTLTKAIELAGCDYAIHLAMAPRPAGFATLRAGGESPPESRLVAPPMTFSPARVLDASPDDFFYLVVRDAGPDGNGWAADSGAQPAPTWMPAVHALDVTDLGAQVHVTSFSSGRFEWRLRAGTRELRHRDKGSFATGLPDGAQGHVLAAIALGTSKRRHPRGLATEGSVGLPFRPEAGLLVVDRARGISITSSEEKGLPPQADASELPLTAEDGKLRPEGREVGSMRQRGAACVKLDGSLVIAVTTFDSDEATTEALLDLGCRRVVALDRGAHTPAFVHRAGTPAAPEARYEPTVLYAIEAPMQGRVARLTGAGSE